MAGLGAHSRVDENPAEMARFGDDMEERRHKLAHAVAADARRLAPTDSGRLADSIDVIPGAEVDLIVCDAPYWAHVEYGTDPHRIESTGPWPLRDKHGNVFGRVVDHPGTPAQPFLRPAMFRGRVV